MLAGNWRDGNLADGTPYGFTCPAPPRYRHQWYWDSCFHAIVWRHFHPERAREELRTLLRGGRLDGFIPHTVFWHDRAGWRRAPFYATHSLRGNRGTAHIQTPAARARVGAGRGALRRRSRVPRPRRSTRCGCTTTGSGATATPTATG